MDGQIDEQVKQDRMDILMRQQMAISAAANESKVGSTVRVLVEEYYPVSEAHFGRSAADAPDIDGKVYFKAEHRIAPGSMIDVKVREVLDYDLYGRAVMSSVKGE
jgi:ribosomal protein S12 methylthiotransferase